MEEKNIIVHSILLIPMLMIFFSLKNDETSRNQHRPYFRAMAGVNIIQIISELIYLVLHIHFKTNTIAKYTGAFSMGISFASYYVILSLFSFYAYTFISQKKKISHLWATLTIPVCAVYALGWFISCFNGMFYNVQSDIPYSGILYHAGLFGGFFVFADMFILIITSVKSVGIKDSIILLNFIIFPSIAVILRHFRPDISFMPISISFLIMLVYSYIQVRQAQLIKEQEVQLSKDKFAIMISQIRPHFIFNSLNSIYVLCGRDPEVARKAINDFSSYLRTNIEILENDDLIPAAKELEHLEHYLNLEKLRFGDDLNIEYDIGDINFKIPPLTLQPIVENAVKHGILKRKGGGTVRISIQAKDNMHEICVDDDGVGFDINSFPADGIQHIGMKNVRERLYLMCHGNLDIQSIPGKGTWIKIQIPDDWY